MTAISSLQSIHKKGIFGDHHKQNQKDLTQISEIKKQNLLCKKIVYMFSCSNKLFFFIKDIVKYDLLKQ